MACIARNYKKLWDKLAPEQSTQLWDMATSERDASVRNHFVEYLKCRVSELGRVADGPLPHGLIVECDYPAHDWCWDTARVIKEPFDRHTYDSLFYLSRDIIVHATDDRHDVENIYGAFEQPCMAGWELRICAMEETRAKIPDGKDGLMLYDSDDEQGPSTRDTETNSLSSKEADNDAEASNQDNDGNTTD